MNTEDIWRSIDYSTITQKQLERWYNINLGHYRRGTVNESFVVFNKLLIENYLDLKSQGILEAEIKKTLNVSDEVYDFWCQFDPKFERKLKRIKLDLITKAIHDKKTRSEIIEYAGVTPKEYEDIFKVADLKGDEISQLRNREIEDRKKQFVKYLLNFDLRIACAKSKFTVDDFYDYYDTADENSEFFIKSTRILMDKYLALRRRAKGRCEAMERVGIREKYFNRWLKRSQYRDFKDEDLKITLDLIIRGFKKNMAIDEVAQYADVSVSAIKRNIKIGSKGSEMYRPLFEYYEAEILPEKLSKFLTANQTKSIRKAMDSADLTVEELNHCYNLGKSGDERFSDFYKEFLDIKKGTYVYHIHRGKSHRIAMRESFLTQEEYDESKNDLDRLSRMIKVNIVLETIKNRQTSNVAASKAGCSVEDIYDWYFQGRAGDKDLKDFYEAFHHAYVKPNIVPLQEKMDNENANLDTLIWSNKDKFTKKDAEIWLEHGLIHAGVIHLDDKKEDEDEDEEDEVAKISINTRFSRVKHRSSLGGVQDDDIEKLKKELLGEK